MSKKILVECVNFNGFMNVKFIMNSDDFRLKSDMFGYKVIEQGYLKSKVFTTVSGKRYQVLSDCSARLLD